MSETDNGDVMARISALVDADSGESPGDEHVDENQQEVDQEPAAQADIEEFLDANQEGAESPDDDGENENEQEQEQDLNEGLDVKALAERLGVDAAEIYDIQFKYGDGESMSLGELKDLGSRSKEIEAQGESLTIKLEDHENDQLRSRAEMNLIISMLPKEAISEHFVETAREQHRIAMSRERISLLEAIPAWQEPQAEKAGRELIISALDDYGFSKGEVAAMLDHRLVKVIHDFARLREKVRNKGEVVRGKIKAGKAGNKPGSSRSRKSADRLARAKDLASNDLRKGINTLFEV